MMALIEYWPNPHTGIGVIAYKYFLDGGVFTTTRYYLKIRVDGQFAELQVDFHPWMKVSSMEEIEEVTYHIGRITKKIRIISLLKYGNTRI